jgi:hypothetical protein
VCLRYVSHTGICDGLCYLFSSELGRAPRIFPAGEGADIESICKFMFGFKSYVVKIMS